MADGSKKTNKLRLIFWFPCHLVTKPDRYIFMLEHRESIYTSFSLLGTDFALDLGCCDHVGVPRPPRPRPASLSPPDDGSRISSSLELTANH